MVENLSKGVDARDIAKAYTQRNPDKTLEDLIDSIDRLVRRIHDSRVSSKELVEVISNIERLTRDIASCIRYPCDSDEIRDYYDKLELLRGYWEKR
jgi:hypothetical protein